MAAMGPGEDGGPKVLFQDHFEARQMGEHVREVRFKEPVLLHSVQILNRGEKLGVESLFEGRTFPNVRTMSLSVYASDVRGTTSAMPKLRQGEAPGSFAAGEMLTDCIVVRGEFMKLSMVVFGYIALKEAVQVETRSEQFAAAIASHLRPSRAFDPERLDLADLQDPIAHGSATQAWAAEPALAANDATTEVVSAAPPSLARALGLGGEQQTEARFKEIMSWAEGLYAGDKVEDSDAAVERLDSMRKAVGSIIRAAPFSSAVLVSYGPRLVAALLRIAECCEANMELRPLRAALKALATALGSTVMAPAAAEVLHLGGLARLLALVTDKTAQSSLRLAAMRALLQLCSNAVGMEALLGLSANETDAAVPEASTGYEVVLEILVEGVPGCTSLEQQAATLLRRAAFYRALVKLDEACSQEPEKKGMDVDEGDGVSVDDNTPNLGEVLEDVVAHFEELTAPAAVGRSMDSSVLELDIPSAIQGDDGMRVSGKPSSESQSKDPFGSVYPQLHSYLESFLIGRRLVPVLCLLLRRLPQLPPTERLGVFGPLRRLLCRLLACVGGMQLMTADAPALKELMALLEVAAGSPDGSPPTHRPGAAPPAVPRFPEGLARRVIGMPQIAALLQMHLRANRLTLSLIRLTREKGSNGLLGESLALPCLCALHQLCTKRGAGRDSVVCAFRSVLLIEWLLRQLEGRLDEATRAGLLASQQSSTGASVPPPPQPSVGHLVAILHTLVVADPHACVAERCGTRVSALSNRTLEMLDSGCVRAEGGDGGSWSMSLEFALDSEGPEGGLRRAVRVGRRSAETACRGQLQELVAQLLPWQPAEGEVTLVGAAGAAPQQMVPISKLFEAVRINKAPYQFKRQVNQERGSKFTVVVGGYTGVELGVEVPEVDFSGEGAEHGAAADEKPPPADPHQLPVLSMRAIARRASLGPHEALEIVLSEERKAQAGGVVDATELRDGITLLTPILLRCAAALGLNLEASALQVDKESMDAVYTTQQAHAQLLEAALQAIFHLLQALKSAGLWQYRNTDLFNALLVLVDRMAANLVGVSHWSAAQGSDPDFRLLWRHCLVWACRVFRTWVQMFPDTAGGHLLQPLMRHTRVLPGHSMPGLLLLATCGTLTSVLPLISHSFHILRGSQSIELQPGDQFLASKPLLLPTSARSAILEHIALRIGGDPSSDRKRLWGQFWGKDCEAKDWQDEDGAQKFLSEDPLVRSLARDRQTAAVASALGLVGRVNSRRDRLLLNDLAELSGLVTQCAVTSNALLHLVVVRVLEKLSLAGLHAVSLVIRVGEAALLGAGGGQAGTGDDFDGTTADLAPEIRDPRDARAVCRVLALLAAFGRRGAVAQRALVEHHAEALCLSVLACGPATLPLLAAEQAIRVLSLMFCGEGAKASHSVRKCRMVSKALSALLNREGDGHAVGPQAMAAALRLLNQLSKSRSMCLNLLFSVDDDEAENTELNDPVAITVSCAFRLPMCARRLARELDSAHEAWLQTQQGTDVEAEAEDHLLSWIRVGELLVSLCQTVIINAETSSVFMAVMLPAGVALPAEVTETMLRGVLKDTQEVLAKITAGGRKESVEVRAAELCGVSRALIDSLLETASGPPPLNLPREVLTASVADLTPGGAAVRANACTEDADVLAEVDALFGSAADLEADPEWQAVAELDPTDLPGEDQAWEFNAVVGRKRRLAAQEKAEQDRKAKRLKQQQQQAAQEAEKKRMQQAAEARKKSPPRRAPSPARGAPSRSPDVKVEPTAQAAPPPSAGVPGGATVPMAALQSFVKDHPQFMRILQNPKKCLGDPRMKAMFVKELENYPDVKQFFQSKIAGLGN